MLTFRQVVMALALALCANCVQANSATVKVTVPMAVIRASGPLVLHIDDIKLPPNSSGIVRVFVDLPNASADTDTNDAHYLGYFTLLARNSAEAAAGVRQKDVTLDVTAKKSLFADRKEVNMAFVPLGGRSDADHAANSEPPTIGRVYLDSK